MGFILTPMIILACLLRADSHVTTRHLTKGQIKERGRESDKALSIGVTPHLCRLRRQWHHQSCHQSSPSLPQQTLAILQSSLLHSYSLISSILSLLSVSDHLFLSLLKFLLSCVSHCLNLTSVPLAALSLHMSNYSLSILTFCLPANMSVCAWCEFAYK